jgi:hypothetical protein
MGSRLKTLVLAVVVGAAALVPLFGDPRSTPLTHPLWARMLLRSLDLTDAVRVSTQASQVFETLTWRDSLSYSADEFMRAQGATVREEAGRKVVVAEAGPADVVYSLAVARPGDYQLRARLSGSGQAPATAEVLPLSGGNALRTFTFHPTAEPAWEFGGATHLDPGAYAAEFLIPPGCTLSQVEVAPPCVNGIEPMGGWKPTAVTTAEDLAVTALKAIDAEQELPPAATPIELTPDALQVEAPPEAVEERAQASGLAAMTLRAGRRGLRAVVAVELPEAGLYSLSALVSTGSGQRWVADGCRKAVVCKSEGLRWRPILNQAFSAGRHTLIVTLGDGATVERVRFEQKKAEATDYVATLVRLGFDPGPAGPVTRAKALDAMGFIRDQRQQRLAELCGDRALVDERTALPPPQVVQGPVVPPPPPQGGGEIGPGPVPPPIGPPVLPPQTPATPTEPTGGGL